MQRSSSSSSASCLRRRPYSSPASGSWMEHGPTTTISRSSSPSRMRTSCIARLRDDDRSGLGKRQLLQQYRRRDQRADALDAKVSGFHTVFLCAPLLFVPEPLGAGHGWMLERSGSRALPRRRAVARFRLWPRQQKSRGHSLCFRHDGASEPATEWSVARRAAAKVVKTDVCHGYQAQGMEARSLTEYRTASGTCQARVQKQSRGLKSSPYNHASRCDAQTPVAMRQCLVCSAVAGSTFHGNGSRPEVPSTPSGHSCAHTCV